MALDVVGHRLGAARAVHDDHPDAEPVGVVDGVRDHQRVASEAVALRPLGIPDPVPKRAGAGHPVDLARPELRARHQHHHAARFGAGGMHELGPQTPALGEDRPAGEQGAGRKA
jgi:hypothetical protein